MMRVFLLASMTIAVFSVVAMRVHSQADEAYGDPFGGNAKGLSLIHI